MNKTAAELLREVVEWFNWMGDLKRAELPPVDMAKWIPEARATLLANALAISTGGEFEPWTEEAKARLNVALGFDAGHPLAWISADGALFNTLESAKQSRPHSKIYPLGHYVQPSAAPSITSFQEKENDNT